MIVETGTTTERPYLRVEDTGIGMTEEAQKNVLEAFRQESVGRSRRYEGSGLGLTITAKLADLVGADLRIDSTKGEGTTVRVTFPAD